MKIKQRKTGKVSSTHVEKIGREARICAGNVMPVARPEILHSYGLCNLAIERLEDLCARRRFINVAERVEVPVVVVPESAGSVGAALRPLLRHALGLVGSWMIDARARFQQIAHRCLLL